MAKVVYIISMGHSGSTLTDLLIGTLPSTFSTGELKYLPWQLYRKFNPDDPQSFCSCREKFENCDFWTKVIQRIKNKRDIDLIKEPEKFDMSLNTDFRYIKGDIKHKVLNLMLWQLYKYLPKKLWKSLVSLYSRQLDNYRELIDAIGESSSCNYVIDSTKDLNRFLLIKEAFPDEVKLVILIRNIHGVVSSNHTGSELSQDILEKRVKYWEHLYYKQLPRVIKKIDKKDYCIINYNELSSNPQGIREKCAAFLGIDNISEQYDIQPRKYHTVAGNPMRYSEMVKIREDNRWKERLDEKTIEKLNVIQDRVIKRLYNIKKK